jgi:hypothetical protein
MHVQAIRLYDQRKNRSAQGGEHEYHHYSANRRINRQREKTKQDDKGITQQTKIPPRLAKILFVEEKKWCLRHHHKIGSGDGRLGVVNRKKTAVLKKKEHDLIAANAPPGRAWLAGRLAPQE